MEKDLKNLPQDTSPLHKHTTKSFVLAVILGIFIGIAVVVPGVSGSTVAIIFGMYAGMLYAIGNIFKEFRRCLAYLFPIAVGVLIGFAGGFLLVQRFFSDYTFALVCLFAGLMIGSIPALTAELHGQRITPPRFVLMLTGIIIPVTVGIASIMLGEGSGEAFEQIPPYLYLLYLPLGGVVAATQIIPGLSATAVLMATGQFSPILNSLHLEHILSHPAIILLLLCLGVGFLVGLVAISKAFSLLIAKKREATFSLVVGLALGSILSMFFNLDMWEAYGEIATQPNGILSTVLPGVALLVLGAVISFLLVRYELSHRSE